MAKDKFNRTKIHMNVGTIGHVDLGAVKLPEGKEMVMPGNNKEIINERIHIQGDF